MMKDGHIEKVRAAFIQEPLIGFELLDTPEDQRCKEEFGDFVYNEVKWTCECLSTDYEM